MSRFAKSTATHVSIHTPREGGDPFVSIPCHPLKRFQSTPPARGATLVIYHLRGLERDVSIHTPREGGDAISPA